jgi:hypothetical protein
MESNLAQLQSCMYQYSRVIYRSVKDLIDPYVDRPTRLEYRRAVLCECEETMTRLAQDPHYFARPDRALFQDIRRYFPITAQAHVAWVVRRRSSRRSSRPACSTAASRGARRRRGRARHASARRCRGATTARRTSTSSGRRCPLARPRPRSRPSAATRVKSDRR